MGRKRKTVCLDIEKTNILGQDELFVLQEGSNEHIYEVRLKDEKIECCPFCGTRKPRKQGIFKKEYYDIICVNGKTRLIKLEYCFYKYRCTNNSCRRVFSKQIQFASKNDNVTYRLEKEIVRRVIRGMSYNEISLGFKKMLTKQGVGQIFNRWVNNKEENRRMVHFPTKIALITGYTDKDRYFIILSLEDGIRLMDIQFGISAIDISRSLEKYGYENIKCILTDCNPTVVDTVYDILPHATYIIPVQYWFKLVTEDFEEFSREILRWASVNRKDEIIMKAQSALTALDYDGLERLKKSRPAIMQPYADYNELRDLINSRERPWTINDLDVWTSHVDPDFRSHLEATILRLNAYKELIYQHELHRNLVPDRLFSLAERLEKILSASRTFSDIQLKARLLYSVPAELDGFGELDEWRGIPIETVISALEEMNLQRRRNRNEYE